MDWVRVWSWRGSVGFSNTGDLILDLGWKTMVELLAEGSVTPLDAYCKAVEVDKVLHNALTIMHTKVLKFGFGFGIVQTEVVFQLCNEVRVVIKPWQTIARGQ